MDSTGKVDPSEDKPCAQCGGAPTTPWNVDPASGFREFDYHLCVMCALTADAGLPPTGFLHPTAGASLTGLPDPEQLPSIMQITDLNEPSDTELPD